MRWSLSFLPTLREAPADAESASHKLMVRAGLVRQLAAGIYSWLPLGLRALRRVMNIVREEMDRAGAVETYLPVVHPAELWKETSRYDAFGETLCRFKDRKGHELVLGPTHEEVITDIVRGANLSYRHLPVTLYQIQTKIRDEARPRFGVIRTREFIMKDAYSFDVDAAGLDRSYKAMYDAYVRVFTRCGLRFLPVEADPGLMGGDISHEFMVLAEAGEDQIVRCASCGYSANRDKAEIRDTSVDLDALDATPVMPAVKPVATPGQHTVEQVGKFLNVPPTQIVKTILFRAGSDYLAALVRGDHEVNPAKLQRAARVPALEMATADEIQKVTGGPMGFSGPVGLNLRIVADRALRGLRNFVTGGNRPDVHLVNVNLHRDFEPEQFADIRFALAGDACPRCGEPMAFETGIEVGHVFKLGTRYSAAMRCEFLDAAGARRPAIMGCYGIGVTRIVAAAIENHHDAAGIIWPREIAPFQVEVVSLKGKEERVQVLAEQAVAGLEAAGFDVLWDDRDESPGVKFADADLIGIPIRVTVGRKSVEAGTADVKSRSKPDQKAVALEEIAGAVRAEWEAYRP